MITNAEATTDWVNLPEGTQPVSLWESVHDAELRSVKSDILARSLQVTIAVRYLSSFHGMPDDLTFVFYLEGVQSVRVLRYTIWPGEFSIAPGLDWEEQQRRTVEHRSKWREESESWPRFEAAVASDDESEITDGDVVRNAGAATLRLGVQMSDGEWYNVFMRAGNLMIRRSDDQPITLELFLELGTAYWDAFAKQTRSNAE